MKDETILYDARTVRFCVLNETASFVWDRLQSPRSFDDLVHGVAGAYGVGDSSRVAGDLEAVLTELVDLSFLSSSENGQAGAAEPVVDAAPRPSYAAPSVRVMDESEVLAAFQVASASVTWWSM